MAERLSKEEQTALEQIDFNNLEPEAPNIEMEEEDNRPEMTSLAWTDYVMSLLDETELIEGAPKTDGLRRIAQVLLGPIYKSESKLVHFAETVVVQHTLVIGWTLDGVRLNEEKLLSVREFTDLACVNSGNTPEKFLNHPVESAASKAEGRALRKALNLKKLAAEELLKPEKTVTPTVVVENPAEQPLEMKEDGIITSGQITAIKMLVKRLCVDFTKVLEQDGLIEGKLTFKNGQDLFEKLSNMQKGVVPEELKANA